MYYKSWPVLSVFNNFKQKAVELSNTRDNATEFCGKPQLNPLVFGLYRREANKNRDKSQSCKKTSKLTAEQRVLADLKRKKNHGYIKRNILKTR